MPKHRAEPFRKPPEWRGRALRNRWYAFTKPAIRARYRATQAWIRAFINK